MSSKFFQKIKTFSTKIGPGIITGAADDDPSGIMTCLIVGAQTGLSLIWTTIITIPLMAAVQEMCARIGLATKHGLAGNMKRHFHPLLLYSIAFLMFAANTVNIAADLSGMIASIRLILPVNPIVLGLLIITIILTGLVFFSYGQLATVFRWLTLPVLAYIASALLSNLSFRDMLFHTFWPHFEINKITITAIVAILGTTISPYLFFWQASEEIEEQREQSKGLKRIIVTKNEIKNMRTNVYMGMILSNIVMFFILASAAGTLNQNGITNIITTDQAALALAPIAGRLSAILFSLGIIGTGILAIPVLAGSAAYAISEAFSWQEGLDKRFSEAKPFYLVIILATILGLIFSFLPINPVDLLYFTAIIYGLLSPLMISLILFLANNKRLMGNRANNLTSNIINFLALIIMTAASISLIFV